MRDFLTCEFFIFTILSRASIFGDLPLRVIFHSTGNIYQQKHRRRTTIPSMDLNPIRPKFLVSPRHCPEFSSVVPQRSRTRSAILRLGCVFGQTATQGFCVQPNCLSSFDQDKSNKESFSSSGNLHGETF